MFFKKLAAIENIHGNSANVKIRAYKDDLLHVLPPTIKPIFSKINFRMTKGGIIHINQDLSVSRFNDLLKKGEFQTAFHMANPKIKLNAAQLAILQRQVDSLPEFHINKQKVYVDSLKKKIPSDILKKLEKVENAEDFEKLINSNTTLTNTISGLIKELKKSRGSVRGFSFKFKIGIFVIGSAALLYHHIEKYRTMMSGCLLYQYKNNEMKTCKLVSHSCRNKMIDNDENGNYSKCDDTVLPNHIRENNCLTSNWTETANQQNSGCHNCNLNLASENEEFIEQYGNIKLVCNENVSLISAIGDIIYHLPTNIQSTVNSLWKYIKYFFVAAVLVMLSYLIYYVRRFMTDIGSFL